MTQPRDDVQRLFDRVVEVLARRAPHLIDEPIPVADLYERLVPYRANRSSLGFDTNQDYEMALLRLLAGEHDLAQLDHDEGRQALIEEARSVNPNPGAFRAYGAARVRLNPHAADAVLQRGEGFAPPPDPLVVDRPPEPPPPLRPLPFEFERAADRPLAGACPHCNQQLPAGRAVAFCPFCGGNAAIRACPQCGTTLETAWRHCITCGYRLGG